MGSTTTFSLSSLTDLPPTPPSREGSSALRLSFASLKPQFAASTDLIPAVLEVLRQAPGQSFTCRQIEAALRQAGHSFAYRTLQNILPRFSRHPGVCVIKNGNTNTYRWDPPKS